MLFNAMFNNILVIS